MPQARVTHSLQHLHGRYFVVIVQLYLLRRKCLPISAITGPAIQLLGQWCQTVHQCMASITQRYGSITQ
jgi:hypothetical protein